MPQFFIVNSKLVEKKIFNQIKITNRYASEQCLGDSVIQFCKNNSTDFDSVVYSICDYAYPKFVDGLKYNGDRTILPRYIDGVVNAFRRFKTKFS